MSRQPCSAGLVKRGRVGRSSQHGEREKQGGTQAARLLRVCAQGGLLSCLLLTQLPQTTHSTGAWFLQPCNGNAR